MTNVLEVRNLTTEIPLRSATVHAVDGLSFDVAEGETVGIVGESGCGKTMAAMSIIKLLPARARIVRGEVKLSGRDLVPLSNSEIRKVRGNEIGTIFQDPMTSLNPTMPIGRQIAEAVLVHRGTTKREAKDRAAEVLGLVGLPHPRERLGDYPHQLSGGLRQRVMIAIALACEPKLLIADEPTTALDVTIQAQILRVLDDIKQRLGTGIILITHDMGVIAGRADRVVVMYAGQRIESAPTRELFSRVRHPYTEALLASIPRLDQDKSQALYSIPGLPPDLRNPPPACRFAPRCAFATAQCRAESPELSDGGPEHLFACWHPRDTSAKRIERAAAELVAQAARDSTAAKDAAATSSVAAVAVAGATRTPEAVDRPGAMLEFRAVSKEFEVGTRGVFRRTVDRLHAVSGVDLAIRRGETFGLVGESGCGKTTLGRVGVALESPTSGQVIFDGVDLGAANRQDLRRLRREIPFMFQDPYASLDPRMRVREIIAEPLNVAKLGARPEREAVVRRLLNEVGLPGDSVDRYPHEFSGGQRQRLGLARAMALNPKMIIADEPVSALDVSIRSQVLNLMKRLQAEHGLTYLMISHDLSVVRYMADRIGVMYLGKIVEIGTGDDIYERPVHPYTAGLLEAIPEPDPDIAREKASAHVPIKGELPSPINPPSGCRFRVRCPFAQDLCAEVEPPLREFGGAHRAACHFPLQRAAPEESAGS
jgi:peptide/nickel transport system ATP-binding protein